MSGYLGQYGSQLDFFNFRVSMVIGLGVRIFKVNKLIRLTPFVHAP